MTTPSSTWRPHWPITVFVLALLPCLIGLGCWQLHRADEKRALQQQFETLRTAPPIGAQQLTEITPAYTPVQIEGVFDNTHSFLLDNRVLHGRVGYEVVTPFLPTGEARVLFVNRGWIAGDPSRQRPTIPSLPETLQLQGFIYRDGENKLIGADAVEKTWPHVIQQIDIPLMQAAINQMAYPYVLRLHTDSPAALAAEWPVVTSSPERHTAYAVQWFAMAAALVLLWGWHGSNLREYWRLRNADRNETRDDKDQ